MTAAARFRGAAALSEDEGALSLFLAIVITAAFITAGIVVDAGGALTSRERAADIAGQAARAGANALTGSSLREAAGGLQVGAADADKAAQRVITAADPDDPGAVTGTVTVTGHQVSVKVTVTQPTHLLGLIGVSSLSQSASASATVVYGGTDQEG
jgi:hypothetical protein